jgi:mutator protein MutT
MLFVTCAIIIDAQKVLCAKRGFGMSMQDKWEFPGGKVEQGETYEQCLERELHEELGIKIKILEKLPESPFKYESGLELTLIPMVCELISGTPHPHEHSEIQWVEFDDLPVLDWADADVPVVMELLKLIEKK